MNNIEKRKSMLQKMIKKAEQDNNAADDNFVNDVSNADDVSVFVDQYADHVIDQILDNI